MSGKTYKIICKNELASQHFESVLSLFCDNRHIELQEEPALRSPLRDKPYKVSNERKFKRNKVNMRAICFDPKSSTKFPIATTVNISSGGICLDMPRPIQTGKRIKIKLLSPKTSNQDKELIGHVVWSHSTKVGVQFQN